MRGMRGMRAKAARGVYKELERQGRTAPAPPSLLLSDAGCGSAMSTPCDRSRASLMPLGVRLNALGVRSKGAQTGDSLVSLLPPNSPKHTGNVSGAMIPCRGASTGPCDTVAEYKPSALASCTGQDAASARPGARRPAAAD